MSFEVEVVFQLRMRWCCLGGGMWRIVNMGAEKFGRFVIVYLDLETEEVK